jgi:hypothetical protein
MSTICLRIVYTWQNFESSGTKSPTIRLKYLIKQDISQADIFKVPAGFKESTDIRGGLLRMSIYP